MGLGWEGGSQRRLKRATGSKDGGAPRAARGGKQGGSGEQASAADPSAPQLLPRAHAFEHTLACPSRAAQQGICRRLPLTAPTHPQDVLCRRPRRLEKVAGRKVLLRVQHVQQVVGDAPPLLRTDLGWAGGRENWAWRQGRRRVREGGVAAHAGVEAHTLQVPQRSLVSAHADPLPPPPPPLPPTLSLPMSSPL